MTQYLVADLAKVSEFFGVAYDTVKTWKRNGMPGGNGRYDLGAIARWRLARDRQPKGTDLAHEEKRLSLMQKRLGIEATQRKAEVEKGKLLERGTVEAHLGLMLTQFQQSLATIPQSLAHEEDRREADRRIRSVLAELSDQVKALAPQAERIAQIVAQSRSPKASVPGEKQPEPPQTKKAA